MLEIIVSLSRPKYDLDDIIRHIPIHDKPKTEAKSAVSCFLWIIRGDISITDRSHGIYPPIQSVEVLYLPIEAVDR